MRENKTVLNWAIALSIFVVWGNVVSLLIPSDQYDTVIKLIDFVSLVYALAVLVSAVTGKRREHADGADEGAATGPENRREAERGEAKPRGESKHL